MSYWTFWRIPRVRKYQVEFEISFSQFLFGAYYWNCGFSLNFGPIELSISCRCDCCP